MTSSARLTPLPRDTLLELEPIFARFEKNTGTLPNNLLVMARRPSVLHARAARFDSLHETPLARPIRDLVFLMASVVSGCRY